MVCDPVFGFVDDAVRPFADLLDLLELVHDVVEHGGEPKGSGREANTGEKHKTRNTLKKLVGIKERSWPVFKSHCTPRTLQS